ncbi:MAG: peptide ABC transporter substrate-binding protein [Chloroflexi bacterium]|nr:peptide ABC transporter substrate-binding protein [Chloroflexota bacterium]
MSRVVQYTAKISRRNFLQNTLTITGVAGVGLFLQACGAQATPTEAPKAAATQAPPPAAAATTVPTQAPAAAPTAAPTKAAAAATGSDKTILGLALPADAAPYDQQIYRCMITGAEPQHMERAASVSGSGSIYPFYYTEPLVKLNEDNELVPVIAESWNLESDGLTWTFKIRKGLEWSDGVPLTAKDVEFTYQRMADPKVAFDWAWFFADIKNFKEVNSGKAPMSDLGVKAVDDYTFQAVMNAPAPYFPDKTLMVTISPQHVIKTTDGSPNWSTDPKTAVASGPWKLASWEKGKQIVFEANPNYKGVLKPFIKTIIIKVGSPESVQPAYEAGEIDATAYEGGNITPADIAKAKSDPARWGVHSYVDYGAYFLMFNNQMDPFTNTKVRQAIAKSIDKNALAGSIGRDLSVPAFSMLPPGFPAHNPALKDDDTNKFDPAGAKKLLADAGFLEGKGLPKITLYTWSPLNALRKGWIEGVQAQIKKNLGIDTELNTGEIKVFYAEKAKHVYPFTFQQYQFDYFDPSNLLDLWKTGNYDYSNKDYDALIDKADHFVGSKEDRIKLYQQAEKILVDEAGAIFLFWPQTVQFWRPYLKGKSLEPSKLGVQSFRGNKLGLTHYNMYITKDRPAIKI